jgi:hypothetical protein
MATTVGSHSVSAFATPVNGGPLDANVVRGNDNTIRTAYVAHDADTGIHVQSSSLASRPSAGTAGRKWITADTGVYKLWYDDGTTWHEVAAGNIDVFVIADEALVKGDVVKVTGYNNGTGAPRVAKVSSASDVAFGIVNSTSIANGATGYITNTGLIQDVATNAFSVGDILYPNTSGGFTATKPTSGNYQPIAFVLRSNANNGVLYVEFSTPRIVERSDNTASTIVLRDASGNFSAGTITAGAVTSTGLVTFASLKGTGATTVTNILDEDNMASDSATALATQQSIKAYVDTKVATVDTLAEVLANGNTTGANDIIVSAGQKIQTPTIAAADNTTAISIANSTGALTLASALADSNLATISTAGKVANSATTATSTNTNSAIVARDSSGNFSAGTITANLTGNISGTAPAGTLTGTTLASNVVSSSLTSVGTLTSLAVTGDLTVDTSTLKVDSTNNRVGVVNASPAYPLDVTGNANLSSGSAYKINGTDVLSGTTLGSGVTASSLTSVGTLTSLTVSGGATFASTSGNFGIGTTSPVDTDGFGKALDVRSATGGQLIIRDSDDTTRYGRFAYDGTDNSAWVEATGTGSLIRFRTAGTQKMSLDASGNLAVDTNTLYVDATNNRVGIGTATPSTPLHVVGIARTGGVQVNTSALVGGMFSVADWLGSGSSLDMAISAYAPSGGGNITFYTNGGSTERMRLDASGNLGLGVTPSAWNSSWKALQLGTVASLWANASNNSGLYIGSNYYYAADGNRKYLVNGAATELGLSSNGGIFVGIAASGTAGNNVTFTQAMTLDASSNLSLLGSFTIGNAGVSSGVINSADSMFFNIDSDNSDPTNANVFAWGKDASTTGSTRLMTLDASGNLGVGVTTIESQAKVEIGFNQALSTLGSSRRLILNDLRGGLNERTEIGFGYQAGSLQPAVIGFITTDNAANTKGALYFATRDVTTATAPTERARITSGGYFKASNTGTYHNSTGTYHELYSTNDNNGVCVFKHAGTNGTQYGISILTVNDQNDATRYFWSADGGGTERATLRSNGGLANYSANNVNLASDFRLKKDIAPLASTWDKLKAIEVVNFRYKDCNEGDPALYGVIAQQVQPIVPELVVVTREAVEAKDAVLDEDGKELEPAVEASPEYYGIREQPMYWLAIKALQEAQARIEALEVEVAALKAGA